MDTLNLDLFHPKKAELTAMAAEYKALTISGVEDKDGYKKVHDARMSLVHARTDIKKAGKKAREEADAFRKEVFRLEEEYIEIIENVEKDLEAKEVAIDKEIEKQKRVALLPERRAKLLEVEVIVEDDALLEMTDPEFQSFLNFKTTEFLNEKTRRLVEEQAKMEAEKKRMEEDRLAAEKEAARQKELESARKEAEEAALRKAEEDKIRAVEDERRKAQEERDRLILEQSRKDQERIEAEKAAERVKEEAAQREREDQEKLEKKRKYQKFLTDNGYTEETKDDFFIKKVGGVDGQKVVLYKKVNELNL